MEAIKGLVKKVIGGGPKKTDIAKEYLEGIHAEAGKTMLKVEYESAMEKEHSLKGDPCPNRVPTYKYTGGNWAEVDPAEEDFNAMETTSLTFYTQNVWFEAHNMEERYQTIVQMALDSDADFLCFQEVIGPFWNAMTQNKEIMEKYYISGNNISGYGVLILSKLPAYFFEFKYETSRMGRSLLVAEVCLNPNTSEDSTFLCGTSHLESLGNAYIRKEQMEYYVDPILGKYNSAFMGDFNFEYNWENEKDTLNRDKFTDLWESLRGEDEESFTMFKTPKYAAVTFDHIILSNKSYFSPEYIERVGNFCCEAYEGEHPKDIQEDYKVRTPSDHLGLVGVVKVKE